MSAKRSRRIRAEPAPGPTPRAAFPTARWTQPKWTQPKPSGEGRGCYERLQAAPRTTPSSSTPPDTDDGTRHEADRQADVASERYDEQRDRCDNEPLLCIRHRSHLIN